MNANQPSTFNTRRIAFLVVFGLAIAAVFGLTAFLLLRDINARLEAPRHDSVAIASGVSLRPFLSLPSERAFPMGLASDPGGTFYLSLFGEGQIRKINPAGEHSLFVGSNQVSAPGALAYGPNGALYLIDYTTTDPRSTAGRLRKIAGDGKITSMTAPTGVDPSAPGGALSLFAQMAFDSVDNLYVTNPATAQIWRYAPDGQGLVWWILPAIGDAKAQPTGIVYDPARNAMIIADARSGILYAVDVAALAPAGTQLFRRADLDIRSLALDGHGRLLVLSWVADGGVLSRLEGASLVTLAEKFRAPTAIVYRDGKVYVVNSDAPGLSQPIRAKPPFTVDVVDLGVSDK